MTRTARGGLWIALVLAFARLAAAGPDDARVADAVMRADRASVRTLLAQGANVNAPQPDGTTALHWAARMGDVDTARLLLKAGAKASATTRYGVTPLHL